MYMIDSLQRLCSGTSEPYRVPYKTANLKDHMDTRLQPVVEGILTDQANKKNDLARVRLVQSCPTLQRNSYLKQ